MRLDKLLSIILSIAIFISITAGDVVIFYGTPLFSLFLFCGIIQFLIITLKKGEVKSVLIYEWVIFLYVMFILMSSLWADDMFVSMQQTYYYVLAFIFFILISNGVVNREGLIAVANSYIFACFISSLIIFYKWWGGALLGGERLTVGDINANYMAYCIASSIPLMAALVGLRSRLSNFILHAFSIIFLVAIFMTGSRGALMAALSALLILNFFYIKRNALYLVAFIIISSMILPYLYDGLSGQLQERFDIFALVKNGDSLSGRLDAWPIALNEFVNNPIIGSGIGGFKLVNPGGFAAHNFILSLLVETGIIGFALYSTIIMLVFIKIISCKDRSVVISTIALAAIWVTIASTGVWEASVAAWTVFGWFIAYSRYTKITESSKRSS